LVFKGTHWPAHSRCHNPRSGDCATSRQCGSHRQRMSCESPSKDSPRTTCLIINTYLFTITYRNKLAYIPEIYMCICVYVYGVLWVDYIFPGWAGLFPFSHSFPGDSRDQGTSVRAPLGHRPCAPSPPLVGGHFGHKTHLNVKTLADLFQDGVFGFRNVWSGWELPLAHVCCVLCFVFRILCVRLVICFDLLTWERRSRHVTAKFTLNYRSSLWKWFTGFAKEKHSEWG